MHLSLGNLYKVLSSDSFSAHGLNPNTVIGDEIWSQKNRDLLDALQFSPTRKQPLRFIVTYAGTNTVTPLYELYEKGLNKENPKMYFHWSHKPQVSWITKEFIEFNDFSLKQLVVFHYFRIFVKIHTFV